MSNCCPAPSVSPYQKKGHNRMQSDQIPTFLGPLAQAFATQNRRCYLVGGFVRNRLLGLETADIDLCGNMLPDEVASLARSAGYQSSIRPCGLGTVDISLSGMSAEYTPFRTESYPPDGAHKPVSVAFTDDMLLDAKRRDFCVNALYRDILTGELHDPLGGLADLKTRTLRACGNTADITLRDDGLRILRMIRLCAELGFHPNDALEQAAHAHARNLLALSPSRIFGEWRRICLCDTAYPTLSTSVDKPRYAIELMHRSGALRTLMPPLYDGVGIQQNKQYHRYDVFWHNLHCFAASPPGLVLRTAALLHDIGKSHSVDPQTGHMYGHPQKGVDIAGPILDVLGMPGAEKREILLLIERHMFDLNGQAKTDTVRIRFANWGFDFSQKLIHLRQSDITGSGLPPQGATPKKWQDILDTMRRDGSIDDMRKLAVNGDDIQKALSLTPGPRIGRIKQMLFDRCAKNPRLNKRDQLLKEASAIHRQLGPSSP